MAVEILLQDGKIYLENEGTIEIKTTGAELSDLLEVSYTAVKRKRDNAEGVLQETRDLVEIGKQATVTAQEMLTILTAEELVMVETVFKKLFDNCSSIADARAKVVAEINASGGSVS